MKLLRLCIDCLRLLCCIAALAVLTAAARAGAATPFAPGKVPFAVEVNGVKVQHAITFRSLLAKEVLRIRLPSAQMKDFQVVQGATPLQPEKGFINWTAPGTPGHYPITITRLGDTSTVAIQAFVMQPASKVIKSKLNGYHIGTYPAPLRGLDAYKAPKGFIELTRELEQVEISPHFTLGQFVCKQASGYPKYLVLRPKLLEKLELLLEEVNEKGIRTDSFVVMSGYRTPFYNQAIRNVAHSRHIYGGAADIYIDVDPVNQFMDDINGDGKTDVKDAAYLYSLADSFVTRTGRKDLMGGVGQYNKTAAHGPFVHIDVRGTRARWGH